MKKTKGWLMGEGNKYIYVQIGQNICKVHVEYEVDNDFKGFSKFLDENKVLIAVDKN